jgi:predicted ATP-grasp superfamily ATP-dependent carboligase
LRVLVTDSDSRSALAAVRALGRAGYEVIAAGVRHPSLASVSRYCSRFEACPNPGSNPEGFVTALAAMTRRLQIDVLMPMSEITTLLATKHRSLLWSGCRLPFPDHEAIAKASDKAYVVGIAEELGIPTPRTVVVQAAEKHWAPDLPYPIVIKPSRSRVRIGSTWLSTSVQYAADPSALRHALSSLPAETYPVLLQERVQGPGRGIFACFDNGRPVALFAHRRLREKPPSGGVSVLCESMALDPQAVEYGTRLLSRMGWHGVAMVEFKEDARDGSLRLMEINARFWGSLQLAIDAGVNFPVILAGVATGHSPAVPTAYQTGVRTRWLAGDLDSLVMLLTRSRRALNLPRSHPGRWVTLRQFLRLWQRNLHYEVERLDDTGPMLLEWCRRLLGH